LDEDIGEYLEIERIVGCKRVGAWKKLSWKEVAHEYECSENLTYGARDNLKVQIKWARLYYD
jgi:hypothetical protein